MMRFDMKINKKDFVEAGKSIQMSPGEMIRTLRELKGWTQVELAEEILDRVDKGLDQAKKILHL